LTVTGLGPEPLEGSQAQAESESQDSATVPGALVQEQEAIVQDLLRRVRYLLTLKGRPPLRLAGIEMFERLTEVKTCLFLSERYRPGKPGLASSPPPLPQNPTHHPQLLAGTVPLL